MVFIDNLTYFVLKIFSN